MTLGTPNKIINLLSSPCLKNVILHEFPKTTRTSAVLKSNKNSDKGRRIVEEPKPAIVPTISAINAIIKNRVIKYSILTIINPTLAV